MQERAIEGFTDKKEAELFAGAMDRAERERAKAANERPKRYEVREDPNADRGWLVYELPPTD